MSIIPFTVLPVELVAEILAQLSSLDLFVLKFVNKQLYKLAARIGWNLTPLYQYNIQLYDWFISNKFITTDNLRLDKITVTGKLAVLKWLRLKNLNLKWQSCAVAAAKTGQLEILKWLQHTLVWSKRVCYNAAKYGHLETLQWLQANGATCNANTCAYAAYGGQLEVLKWLRSIGTPWNERTSGDAAYGGQLDILKWLIAQNAPGTNSPLLYEQAARGGHLAVLKWLRSISSPYNEHVAAYAATTGQLAVLQWLATERMPCAWLSVAPIAAEFGYLPILKWLPTCHYDNTTLYSWATKGGQLEVLKWLRSIGAPWDYEACLVQAINYPSVLEWLLTQGRVRSGLI